MVFLASCCCNCKNTISLPEDFEASLQFSVAQNMGHWRLNRYAKTFPPISRLNSDKRRHNINRDWELLVSFAGCWKEIHPLHETLLNKCTFCPGSWSMINIYSGIYYETKRVQPLPPLPKQRILPFRPHCLKFYFSFIKKIRYFSSNETFYSVPVMRFYVKNIHFP